MIALPIISIVCWIAYVTFVVFRFGVPTSLSETYYLLSSKWDWLFSAWLVLSATPFGIYWFSITPDNLKWIPIVVVICLLFVSVSCRYKSGPKNESSIVKGDLPKKKTKSLSQAATKKSFKEWIKEMLAKLSPKEMLKYGWAKPIHYISSYIAIILTTIYVCIINPVAIPSVAISYYLAVITGVNVDGVYNKDYSLDVDNKAWVFFFELVSFGQLFVFIWTK